MRKYWWKWLGVLLMAFALIGGLYIPLKTGITNVRIVGSGNLNVPSAKPFTLEADIYNFGNNFKVDEVILKNDHNTFRSSGNIWNQEGYVSAQFEARLGDTGTAGEMYTLYIKANKKWMALPNTISIVKSQQDTGVANTVVLPRGAKNFDFALKLTLPNLPNLRESIRNLFYHVTLWFAVIFLFAFSAWHAGAYLYKGKLDSDLRSESLVRVGILVGILGCLTGSFWASITWNTWWPRDPKLNGVAIGMLMYLAYFLLRAGIRDEHQRARVSAVYNLFVYPIFIALIYVMPRLSPASHHPGAGGSAAFSDYDLDNTMRVFFYPAIVGNILVFAWMASLLYRYKKLELQEKTESE